MKKSVVLVLAICVMVFAAGVVGASEKTILGEWMLNEGQGTVINDSSGNNNHGVANNTTWKDGFLQFNGKDSSIKMDYSPVLDIGVNDFCVEAWFKTASSNNQRIISRGAFHDGHKGYQIFIHNGNIKGVFGNGLFRTIIETSRRFNDDVWHHVLVTYDRDGDITLYIDGKMQDAADLSHSATIEISGEEQLTIGMQNPNLAFFDGSIAAVRIYGEALSRDEAKELYAASKDNYR